MNKLQHNLLKRAAEELYKIGPDYFVDVEQLRAHHDGMYNNKTGAYLLYLWKNPGFELHIMYILF